MCLSSLSTFFSHSVYFFFIVNRRNKDVLRTVKDGSYGTENPNEVGGWDGIVGELVRRVCFMLTFPVQTNNIIARYSSIVFELIEKNCNEPI